MKNLAIKTGLVPVQELRAHLAEWIDRASAGESPVIITQRGKAAAVLVSPGMLDEIEEGRELVRKAVRGLRHIGAGHTLDDKDVWQQVDAVTTRPKGRRGRKVD